MCTSIVSNRAKTIVGWNLDILDMEYRVRPTQQGVYIEILDAEEGWMPLFGGNSRGDFVAMPTCWPADSRSEPRDGSLNILRLDIDLLLQNKTFDRIRQDTATHPVCSVPGLTFQSQLSDAQGNVLQIVPGQGCRYLERPRYAVMTNFSPFKMDAELHPWMGWDRYLLARKLLAAAADSFDSGDCFEILKATAQQVCPTVVSMVCDVTDRRIFWCEKQDWAHIETLSFT